MESSESNSDDNFRHPTEPGPSFRAPETVLHGGKRRGSGRKRKHDEGFKNVRSVDWKSISLHSEVYDQWMNVRETHGFKQNTDFAKFLLERVKNPQPNVGLNISTISSVQNTTETTDQRELGPYERSNVSSEVVGQPQTTSTPRKARKQQVNPGPPELTIMELTIPANEKVFIDSVIRNSSVATQSDMNILDSDDESDAEDLANDSANESGDDVRCESSDDVGNDSSDDDSMDRALYLCPDFDPLNITCGKDYMDHDQDEVETTQVTPVDMETSSITDLGSIECNVPLISPEHPDPVEGTNPAVRLLPAGYEHEKAVGLEEHLSSVNEKKFICSISSMRKLFSFCMDVDCKMPLVEVKESFVGCVLEVRWKCQAGHCGEWQSSKKVKMVYVNNLQTAAALLFTGNNFTKLSLFSKCLSLAFFSSSAFHQYQRKFLAPLIQSWWKDMQATMFTSLGNQPVVLSGDGQMDSPGFSAKNCVYTLMHAELDYVLHLEIVDVRQSQLKSAVMEKVGCEKAMDFLMQKLSVTELVTDASSQLIKMLATNKKYENILHQLDIWHKSNKIDKKLLKACKKRKNEVLKAWIAPIRNHFWHCVKNCDGDLKKLKTTWIHLLKHVTNVHTWYNGQCSHGPLDSVDNEKEWINKDSAAMQALRDIILDKKFLKTLPFYTRFRHTGKLEAYHSHRLMYAPKRFGFSYEGLFARSLLAAIDHNHHLHRQQARNAKGELVYSRRWSKRAKRWKVVFVKEKKNYSYFPVMCANVLKEASKEYIKKIKPVAYENNPKKVAATIAILPPPATAELVKEHISRY